MKQIVRDLGTGQRRRLLSTDRAAAKPNLNLYRFFQTVSLRTRALANEDPTLYLSPVHDFVFVPTAETFAAEREVFDTAVANGSRSALEELIAVYSGGYFSRAARTWLDTAQLASPKDPTSVRVVELRSNSNLRVGPSLAEDVIAVKPGGARFAVLGEDIGDGGNKWFSLDVGSRKTPAFVRSDRVLESAGSLQLELVPVDFVTDASGDREAISTSSEKRLREAIVETQDGPIAGVEIVGYVRPGEELSERQRVLGRQAKVLGVLASAGFDASRARLILRGAESEKDGSRVKLAIRRVE